MEIVSPTEGTRIEVGSPFFFQLRPDPGEEWIEVSAGLEVVPFNPLTGMFEVKGTIPKDAKLGSRTTTFTAVARDGREIDLSRTVTVVLPSTITVEAIGAGFNSAKKPFYSLPVSLVENWCLAGQLMMMNFQSVLSIPMV